MAFPKLFKFWNSSNISVLFYKRINTFCVSRLCALHTIYNMNSIYFNYTDETRDKFNATFMFNYENDSMNIRKSILLVRPSSETLEVFLNRMKIKLQNLIMAKMNKKKRKIDLGVNLKLPDFEPNMTLNNEPLPKTSVLKDIFENNNDEQLKLRVFDQVYDVVVNAPLVSSMDLPEKLYIGCPCPPEKVVASDLDIEKSTFTWFKSKNGTSKWIKCGEGFLYVPTDDDLGFFLKVRCLPVSFSLKEGLECEAVSSSIVLNALGLDEILKRHEFTKLETGVDEFRVVSYNILADMYTTTKEAKTNLFTYCNPNILDLDYRKNLWNFELIGYNADIICLQEVDTKVFNFNFKPVFAHKGFKGVYYEKNNFKEGTALFYKCKKFELLESSVHRFTTEILNNPLFKDVQRKIINNEKLESRLGNISSQLQIGILKGLNNENQILVVGNTHLYFHPDADHIRLLQGVVGFRILLQKAEEIKKLNPEKQVSIILCGDFNSTPECGFHTYLNEGKVGSTHPEWSIKEDEVIEGLTCEHSLKMKSSYGTPKYTNYTSFFKACLDYIYFQMDFLELKQIVPIPPEEILSKEVAIPSQFFPSDHVALVADFKFKNK